jgi:hypothetical protein
MFKQAYIPKTELSWIVTSDMYTQGECPMPSNFLCYVVQYNNCYTLLLENISRHFVLQ